MRADLPPWFPNDRRSRTRAICWMTLVFLWPVLLFFGPVAVLVITAVAIAAIRKVGRRPGAVFMTLCMLCHPLVIPPALLLVCAICTFSNGTATRWTDGRPGMDFGSLEMTTRIAPRVGGFGGTNGLQFITDTHNFGLTLAGSFYGPMPGSCHGTYPDTPTALDAVDVSTA
jgi:hypothetical protein